MSKAPRPGHVEDTLPDLRRAELVVGAAEVLVALLLLGQGCPAGGALRRHLPRPQALRAQRQHRPEDLGDHVARLAQDHGVAGADVLALHLVGVVEGGVLDRRPGHPRRLHDAVRRDPAGAADVDPDLEEHGVDLLGWVLERDRPAGRPARGPEPPLERHVVDLDDDPVDLVLDLVAVLAVVLDELLDVLQRGQHLHPRRRRPAPTPRGRGRTRTGHSARTPRGRRCRGRPCRARGWR